jgi:hypothetical protein
MLDIDHVRGRVCRRRLTPIRTGRLPLAIPVWLAAVAWLVAWPLPLAAADDGVCTRLHNELVESGRAKVAKDKGIPAEEANKTPPLEAIQLAAREFVGRPSQFHAELSGQKLPAPGLASVTFEGKKIEALTDTGKTCVKAFINAGSNNWKEIPIQQIFLSEKRLKVVFQVEPAPKTFSTRVDYLFVGVIADTPPTDFSYFVTTKVTNRKTSAFFAWVFVAIFYGFLAWTTYNDDAKSERGLKGLAYALSPIRISAAWFGEASMAQVQVLLFTFIVAGRLFDLWLSTGGLSDVSKDLLTLLGISAVGGVGAKFTQTLKTGLKEETSGYLMAKDWYSWQSVPAREHATLHNLLLTDDRLDVYKFQMAIFTVVVAGYVISSSETSLGEVKISETILYLIGISQGVYVAGKAVTDRTTDLEDAVKKLMDIEPKIRDLDQKIRAAGTPPPDLVAQRAPLEEQYTAAAKRAAIEFAWLQHRYYPTASGVITTDINQIDPKFLKP